MRFPTSRAKLERLLGPIALGLVILTPAIQWIIDSLKTSKLPGNPYSANDAQMALVLAMLALIFEGVTRNPGDGSEGDESKIISNRNQSDYYEIWEEVRGFRNVDILAVGHSFNTLWFNFIKKYLYELASNEKHFDSVVITLIATGRDPGSFADIRSFYAKLELSLARKITINLHSHESDTLFFTGLCVNKSALWLSIREPFSVGKSNEHVREWRRSSGGTAEKMVNWYLGVAAFLTQSGGGETLQATIQTP